MVNNPKVSTQGSADTLAPYEDGALLFRSKAGDTQAFNALLSRYEPLLHKLVASFAGVPQSEREELFQEGLIAFHKAVLLYDESVSSFSTFAYLCVRRSMLSALKKYTRTQNTVSLEELDSMPLSAADQPEAQLIDRESCEQLLSRVDALLSDYENTVLKLHLSGKRPAEMAKLLNKSEKSVGNALSRARKKLSFHLL